MKNKTIAIIPARGGSKGIKDKNLQVIAGKSILEWCIQAATTSNMVGTVYVSTDNEAIAATAKGAGAEVIWRPQELASDQASSESALIDALAQIAKKRPLPEFCVFMQCTSPLTLAEDIDGAIARFIATGADSLFTASDFHYFVWHESEDGTAQGINHDHNAPRQRRQDREKQYIENGAIYIFRSEGFLKCGSRFFGRTVIFEMPLSRCFEIDTPADLRICETLLYADKKTSALAAMPSEIEALVMDFDGVLTDNKVLVSEKGDESVSCNRGDGWGLAKLKKAGLHLCVLSTERNPVVQARCRKLCVECLHNLGNNKLAALKNYLAAEGISPDKVIFIGNDENDIECMKNVGCSAAPCDASQAALNVADIVLDKTGGNGAVRELCELIVKKLEQKS